NRSRFPILPLAPEALGTASFRAAGGRNVRASGVPQAPPAERPVRSARGAYAIPLAPHPPPPPRPTRRAQKHSPPPRRRICRPRRRRPALLTLLVLPPAAAAGDDLASRIEAVTGAPRYKQAHWGLLAVDAKTGSVLYEHNADSLFAPASTTKLYSCATALCLL